MKKSKLKKQSKRPLSVLKREAIQVFNAFIRRRDLKKSGGRCYICRNPGAIHAAHFIHNKNAVRFNEMNVNLCCLLCNVFKSGNLGEYALRLIEDYGLKKMQELRQQAVKPMRFSREYLEEKIKKYKDSYIIIR